MLDISLSVQSIFFIIIVVFVLEFLLTQTLSFLNTTKWSSKLPEELKEIYDEEKYKKSMEYEKAKYSFWNISSIFFFNIMILLLIFEGFGFLHNYLYNISSNIYFTTLWFFGVLYILQTLISLPFSYYSTFVIEEKFWFNKMTKKLFFVDLIKSILLTLILWWAILALITWFFTLSGNYFWLFAWGFVTILSIFMMMFYSSIIVPIFNKQTPLGEWKLRDDIENFASSVWFKLDNIYVIDGSKRSSKANAYFAWFWPKKRIVLFDTLIKDLTNNELVAVLAHEIGHYKKKHTLQMLAFWLTQTFIMFFVLWLALNYTEISFALWANSYSFAVSLVAFGILFTPLSIIFWLFWNILSRRNEYQADEYAALNYKPKKLRSALIKLSRNNLSNLTPHPIYEFFHYTHPSVLKRLKALDEFNK